MAAWLETLHALEQDGTQAVLVTLVAVRGSAPREAGCKMVVTADAAHGTIGGGNLEFRSIAHARAVLAGGDAAPQLREFPLGPALGQCCGGHVTVLFEVVRPTALRIAVFGAGHVGRALIGVLATLDCRVQWIDARAEALAAPVAANVARAVSASPVAQVAALPAGAFVLVMTHDHALDFEIVAAALPRADLPYVGLIGSETKRARFVSRLARAGLAPDAIRRLVCPIGVEGAGGKAPAEIAIAVAAQVLQTRDTLAAFAPAPRTVSADPGGAIPMTPEELMRRAIALSLEKMQAGSGGPFGAVIARDGVIVAEGWNEVTSANDPTAHAEVTAIRRACTALGRFDLSDCEIFTSCEPCPMCLAAVYWARLKRLHYGNDRQAAAAIGFDDEFLYREVSKPIAERTIPTVRMLAGEAHTAFAAWADKADKVRY